MGRQKPARDAQVVAYVSTRGAGLLPVPEKKRPSRIGGTQRQVWAIAAVQVLDRE